VWSQITNTSTSQTDRQTDRRTICHDNTALCIALLSETEHKDGNHINKLCCYRIISNKNDVLVTLKPNTHRRCDKQQLSSWVTSTVCTILNSQQAHDNCQWVRSHCQHDATRLHCWQICSDSSRLSPDANFVHTADVTQHSTVSWVASTSCIGHNNSDTHCWAIPKISSTISIEQKYHDARLLDTIYHDTYHLVSTKFKTPSISSDVVIQAAASIKAASMQFISLQHLGSASSILCLGLAWH